MNNFIGYNAKLIVDGKEYIVKKFNSHVKINNCQDMVRFLNPSSYFDIDIISNEIVDINCGFEIKIQYGIKKLTLYKNDRFVEYEKSDWWWLEKYNYGKVIDIESPTVYKFKDASRINFNIINDKKYFE